MVTSALTVVGLGTAVAAPVAALLALYVLGFPNFYLKVSHPDHIVMLCAMVLSVSPCADTLALDSLLRRGKRGPVALSAMYTTPMRLCWLMMGTVYLFPGLWKLWVSGDQWLSGYQLLGELYEKWGTVQKIEAPIRLDRYPALLAMLGTATLIFEIGFFFALFNPYTRIVAAFSAVGFHLGVAAFLGIRFHALFPLVLLLDFPQLWQRVQRHLPGAPGARATASQVSVTPPHPWLPRGRALPGYAMGVVLLAGQIVTGFGHINTWPISLHPTFSGRQAIATRVSRVVVVLEPASGAPPRELPEDTIRELGPGRLAKVFKRVRRASAQDADLNLLGPLLVELFRRIDVESRPGDTFGFFESSWDLFPLGERAGYERVLTERFRILPDLALAPLGQGVDGRAKASRARTRAERQAERHAERKRARREAETPTATDNIRP